MADEPTPAGRSAGEMHPRGLGAQRDRVRALEQRADRESLSDDSDPVRAIEASADLEAVAAPSSTASPGAPGSDRADAPR